MRDLGKLKEAKISYQKSIKIKPDLAIAYYCLSIFKDSDTNKIWRDQLFSKNFLDNKSKEEQVHLYFARANILHKESNFKESSKYLELANNLYQIYSSNIENLINKSNKLLLESNKRGNEKITNFPESIL